MKKKVLYVGMDVHKFTIDIAITESQPHSPVRSYGQIDNRLGILDRVIGKLESKESELRFVYEAGPCGYQIYRHLAAKGYHCSVVAPSLIPKRAGERIKTASNTLWTETNMGSPGSRARCFRTCTRPPTAQDPSLSRANDNLSIAFRSRPHRRRPGLCTLSRLNTRPVRTPVNASAMTLLSPPHDSGPAWIATPSPYGSFLHYTSPVLTGALGRSCRNCFAHHRHTRIRLVASKEPSGRNHIPESVLLLHERTLFRTYGAQSLKPCPC